MMSVCTVWQYLPPEVGLLRPVVDLLSDWCRVLSDFPVLTWPRFVDYVRSRVNLLATEQHIKELMNQLVVIGEVYSVRRFVSSHRGVCISGSDFIKYNGTTSCHAEQEHRKNPLNTQT